MLEAYAIYLQRVTPNSVESLTPVDLKSDNSQPRRYTAAPRVVSALRSSLRLPRCGTAYRTFTYQRCARHVGDLQLAGRAVLTDDVTLVI